MYAKSGQDTLSRNFVRQMAKQFEQISVDSMSYVNSHEANFKQCNWWLDIPSSATCFDDLTNPSGNDDDCQSGYDLAGESSSAHGKVETAEIAVADEIDLDPEKTKFFTQVANCLSFPSKADDNENTPTTSDTEQSDVFYSLPSIE